MNRHNKPKAGGSIAALLAAMVIAVSVGTFRLETKAAAHASQHLPANRTA
ncbi:hypothetical protein [Burkholderia gladioli]|nr:hypothetical protein [Burkholderia gladioli]